MFDRLKNLIAGERPVDPSALMRGGRLVADAVAAAPAGSARQLLDGEAAAAGAIIAGIHGIADLQPQLAALLDREGLAGRAAAWALGRIGAQGALLSAAAEGPLDRRDNAYWGLAVLAAAGKAGSGLAEALRERVAAEIAKARSGGTGLGEHAVRALAVLGDAQAAALAQAVVDGDRFCDRFELQRIKKAVADGGRDSAAVKSFAAAWEAVFADHLHAEPAPAPAPAPATPPAPAPPPAAAAGPDSAEAGAEPVAGGGKPIDWKGFLASPEAAVLPAQARQMAGQLGQLLEQLAQRAIGAHLADLSRDEFAALLTQVLPQALPPQHVQAALSPIALNAYQALARFLARTKAATQGDGLLQGVKLVRTMMAEQIRRAGILDGPDYSDPDDKPAKPSLKP